ncbi:DUF6270 domain-containing protein [Bacillus subtilis]|uniref:DUF6270 domain-containing protein n=1 Tax=Bacillus subtilis TaxID=1423 RepID=UPI00157642E0|nr:DUF6270 domain-containing protein [Bacillus subtilis]MEC1005345.1 DUF6270 domain-containing protein [Bacillus subtilis]MEC1075503.1 DUF6270 domain-containing protein [Bacillus subtilis]NTU15117.1 hypothetical protein [Bacillus subtilis subsp. subtilis]CAF1797847.1 hypothetical protein NRS6137_00433 [Bacillus subtilis]BET53449.1 hypothetical protein BsubNA05_05550 [Bacillus subtilis]
MSILDVKYDEIKGSLKILCEFSKDENFHAFYLEKKVNHRDTELLERIRIEYEEINSTSLWLNVDLNIIFTSCNISESFWSVYMMTSSGKKLLKFDHGEKTTFPYFIPHQYSIYKVRPYIAKDCSLAFFIRPIDFIPVLNEFKQDVNNQFQLNIECVGADYKSLLNSQFSLSLLRRDQPDLYFYSDEINIAKDDNSSENLHFCIPKDLLINNDLYDVFLKAEVPLNNDNELLSNQKEVYLKVNIEKTIIGVLQENNYPINEFYSLKASENALNQLSFQTVKKLSANISKVDNDEDEQKFTLEIKGVNLFVDTHSQLFFVLKRRRKLGKEVEYYDEIALPLEFNESHFTAKILKSTTFSESILKGNEVWDAFIRINKENYFIESEVSVNKETTYSFNYFKTNSKHLINSDAKFFVNGKSNLSLFISDRQTVGTKPIRIAVMGTCFSRNPFNSRDYFNPGYKKIYECVYTQFHSSIVSLVSEPTPFTRDDFKDIKEQDINFVETDFKKDFFEKLKNSQPDYLIIDLYSDAAKSLIQFSEQQFVSASFIIEQSQFFKNLRNVTIINHTNNKKYFEIYKKSLDNFINKLTEVIPASKIILNKGRFTSKYKDSNGEIKPFGDQDLINRNNYFWDKVDNYFEYKLPSVKIIDLTNTPFIGDERYPFGKSFSHYESAYYKKFMDRLNSIVLEDIQTELR